MDRRKKRYLILIMLPFFLLTFIAPPAFSYDDEGDPAEMLLIIADFAIARPAGLAVTAFGAAFFVVTLPVSAPLQEIDKMFRVFIMEPADFTFFRPLGEF